MFDFEEAQVACEETGVAVFSNGHIYDIYELLGNCYPSNQNEVSELGGTCDSCSESDHCTSMFGQDNGRYWIGDEGSEPDAGLAVDFGTGELLLTDVNEELAVRCYRAPI